jgi:hypothetical protein
MSAWHSIGVIASSSPPITSAGYCTRARSEIRLMQEQQRGLFPHDRPVRHEAGTRDIKKEMYAIYQYAHQLIFRLRPIQLLLPIPGGSGDV